MRKQWILVVSVVLLGSAEVILTRHSAAATLEDADALLTLVGDDEVFDTGVNRRERVSTVSLLPR
jgi:hypothetical protein